MIKLQFEKLSEAHAIEVMDIFNDYAENSFAAYPEHRLPYEFFPKFLESSEGYPAYAIKVENTAKVIGFCLLRPYNPFPVFRQTAEVSYFIDRNYVGKGIGRAALDLLEHDAKAMGIHHLLANISSRNEGSLCFHRRNGFIECGRLKNIGKKHGSLFDVIWMIKSLSQDEAV
ncbi:MAG TPA: GNAT family N-acetyltransferase [Bacillota bacterium]|nr:GNAT family N-acetyltransferase [Bacillota bacterium]